MNEQSVAPSKEDLTTVACINRAILEMLLDRYSRDVYNHLLESIVLDPRFRALLHVGKDKLQTVFDWLTEKVLQLKQNQVFNYIDKPIDVCDW